MNEYHNFMHAWKFLEVWGTLFVAHQHSVHFRPSSQKPVLLGTPLTSPLLISRPQVPSSKGPTRLGQAQQSTALRSRSKGVRRGCRRGVSENLSRLGTDRVPETSGADE